MESRKKEKARLPVAGGGPTRAPPLLYCSRGRDRRQHGTRLVQQLGMINTWFVLSPDPSHFETEVFLLVVRRIRIWLRNRNTAGSVNFQLFSFMRHVILLRLSLMQEEVLFLYKASTTMVCSETVVKIFVLCTFGHLTQSCCTRLYNID
jgi:hypothetical protein